MASLEWQALEALEPLQRRDLAGVTQHVVDDDDLDDVVGRARAVEPLDLLLEVGQVHRLEVAAGALLYGFAVFGKGIDVELPIFAPDRAALQGNADLFSPAVGLDQ